MSKPKESPPEKAVLDRDTARALTEAGYMPLAVYLEMFPEPVVEDEPKDQPAPKG